MGKNTWILPLLVAIVIIPFANAAGIANKMNGLPEHRENPTGFSKIELYSVNGLNLKVRSAVEVEALITGYNTVIEQTDSTPCISASGDNICGKDNVVACPRKYPFGSIFGIRGREYVCLDRLAEKYDSRFDINCNLDFKCSRIVSREMVKVLYVPSET